MNRALSAASRRGLYLAPLLVLSGCPVEDRQLDYGTISAGSTKSHDESTDAGAGGSADGGAGSSESQAGALENADGGAPLVAGGTSGHAGAPATTGGSSTTAGAATGGAGGTAATGGTPTTAGTTNASGTGSGGINGNGGGGSAGTGGTPDDGPCGDIDQNGVQDCQETIAKNATFDADTTGWDTEFNLTEAWKADDARSTHGSGSLSITFTTANPNGGWASGAASQCLPAWGEKQFELGARAFIPNGQGAGNAQINLAIFGNDDCAGSFMGTTTPAIAAQAGSWQVLHSSVKLPAGARSVLVRLAATKPGSQASLQVSFDDVLFREK